MIQIIRRHLSEQSLKLFKKKIFLFSYECSLYLFLKKFEIKLKISINNIVKTP